MKHDGATAGAAQPAAFTIRRASAADLPALRDFIAGLSIASRASRFFVPLMELPPPLVAALEGDDPLHHFLVARETSADGDAKEGPVVGLAQYVRQPAPAQGCAQVCEVALVVADACQGSGLGRRLMLRLLQDAEQDGLQLAVGDVLRRNRAMLGLARRTGFSLQRHPDDPMVVQIVRPVREPSLASEMRVAA